MSVPKFSRREIHDALQLAIQASVSAALLFILMQSLAMPEKFVGVLSAVLVISPGLGSTIAGAWKRVAATVIGAGVGCLCLWLIPGGYGTAAALGVSMFVMNAIAGLFPQWQYGVVAAVALALGSEQDLIETAKDRTFAIALGVIVGGVCSVVIWPQKSSTRADAFIRDALKSISKILATTLSATKSHTSGKSSARLDSLNNRYSSMISNARSEAANVRIADNGVLMDRINATDWLYKSLATIRLIADNEDDIEGGDGDASAKLDHIKSKILDVLKNITGRKRNVSGDDLSEIEDGVTKFREIVSQDNDLDNWNHVNRATLVFALDQVYESLRKLSKDFSKAEEG